MWKCKECDCEIFYEVYQVTRTGIIYDKDSKVESWDDLEEAEWVVNCCECGNDGKDIEEIAEWDGE